MMNLTLYQLQCLDAVVRAGSFQAAAKRLNRSHPSVFAAIKALEEQTGVTLFDRSGYRVALTRDGQSFHEQAKLLLEKADNLKQHAAQLSSGEETSLDVTIGDVCPLPAVLGLLNRFFASHQNTQLDLRFEALAGPLERLTSKETSLIIHHIDKSDMRLEFIPLFSVRIIPVAAPGFLPFAITRDITPEQLRPFPQCIIRDTARHIPRQNHFIIEGARHWTVADQLMKKEIIKQAMGWGHLPAFLAGPELQRHELVELTGKHLPGKTVEIVAARLRNHPHGPVANRLWHHIEKAAGTAMADC